MPNFVWPGRETGNQFGVAQLDGYPQKFIGERNLSTKICYLKNFPKYIFQHQDSR